MVCSTNTKEAKDICWSQLKEVLNQFNSIEDINETTLTITIRKQIVQYH